MTFTTMYGFESEDGMHGGGAVLLHVCKLEPVTDVGKLIKTSFDGWPAVSPGAPYPLKFAYRQAAVPELLEHWNDPGGEPAGKLPLVPPCVLTSMFMMPAVHAASAAPRAIWRWNHQFDRSSENATAASKKRPRTSNTTVMV